MFEKPEVIQFADDRPTSTSDDLYQWVIDAEQLIRDMQATITNLEKESACLKQDAARYRFVKTMPAEMLLAWRGMYGFADAAIDTAMQKD